MKKVVMSFLLDLLHRYQIILLLYEENLYMYHRRITFCIWCLSMLSISRRTKTTKRSSKPSLKHEII